jgi:eukaryotic-like serine/threonine-protein kinase
MALTLGTRFGHYEITGSLGKGGMGEVYRARDTELGRDVAIKTLPASFAADADRVARFEQEARTLAALNHPNVAQIYGLERAQLDRHESGPAGANARDDSGTTIALVMELVEGPTLADRITEGPIPADEALGIAMQIADALEAAHDKLIVHRDLKPANVKLRPDGTVKVLDFGIAKAFEPAALASGSDSPILTTPATQAGVILGTAAYMSPEQAKGKAVDKRTDIWAFGCVLYEMLTGQLAFGGEDVATTLARVIANETSMSALPATISPTVRRVLELCLRKDSRNRIRDIGDVKLALAGDFDSGADAQAEAASVSAAGWRRAFPVAFGLIAAGLIAGVALWALPPPVPITGLASHYALQLPGDFTLPIGSASGPHAAVSPNGHYIAYALEDPATRRSSLWIQAIDSLTPQRLDRADGAQFPFWSPDSQQIAYFSDDKLMRISIAGGSPLTVSDAESGEGGYWYDDESGTGFIVFGSRGPLRRVPAMGGIATPVTSLATNEFAHLYPQMLPDGRLLYASMYAGTISTFVQSPGSAERTTLMTGMTRAVYTPPGYLLYVREGTLLAQRFDLESLELQGDAVALAQDVRATPSNGRSAFSASSDTLVYRRGSGLVGLVTQVRWYDRDGTPGEVVVAPGGHGHVELSPDNRYLAVTDAGTDGAADLWIKDFASGTYSRLTSSPGSESQEAWAPDSRHLAFSTAVSLFYTELGTGSSLPVAQSEGYPLLHSWTPDGRYLLAQQGPSVSLIPAPPLGASDGAARQAPQEVFSSPYAVDHFRVSPDSNWVAYTSQESGQPEIVVAAFPSFTARRQVSISGGTQPQWRADGRELFFHANDQHMMAVEVTPGESLEIGPIHQLFATNETVHSPIIFMYAATSDGQRFLLTEPVEGNSRSDEPLYVMTNWQTLLDTD